METWLIAASPWLRAILGLVFLIAAVTKLRDPEEFSAALGALGIEDRVPRESLTTGVPLAEAGLGVWLWTGWRPLLSAATASVVLVLLTLVLIRFRSKGYTGKCGCFIGDRHAGSAWQILRNAALLGMAVWVGLATHLAPGSSVLAPGWRGRLFLLAVIVLGLTWAAHAWRTRQTRLSATAEPKPAGAAPHRRQLAAADVNGPTPAEPTTPAAERAPRLELTDLAGEPVVLGEPERDAQLLVFARGGCPGCLRDRDLLNGLPDRPRPFETFIVCGGDIEATKEFAEQVRPPVRVIADPRWRTAVAFQVSQTPFTVLVDCHGQVRARGKLTSTLSLVTPQVESP